MNIRDRSLWALSWPILFELLMLYMIPAVDAYYMARVSPHAVAAVAAILPLVGLGNILFMPLAQAAASVAAQHLGAGHPERARSTFTLLLLVQLTLGLGMALFFYLGSQALPELMGLRGEMLTSASHYLAALAPGYVFLGLKIGTTGILNAMGLTKLNMAGAALMNLVNLALCHLLSTGVFGLPRFGEAGIASASVCAWLSAMLLGFVFCRRHLATPTEIRGIEGRRNLGHVLRIGIPSALEPLSWQLSQVAISGILVQLGAVALTTKAFVFNITLFSLIWSAAFSGGTQIKIAHLLGAQELQEAQRQLIKGVRMVLLGCTVLSVILALLGRPLLGFFTSDPEVIALGSKLLWFAIIMEWGRALNVLVGAALRASGDARFVATFGVFCMWGLAVLGSYLLGYQLAWGLTGVWLAMIVDEHARGWMNLWRWNQGHWQSKIVYRRAPLPEAAH